MTGTNGMHPLNVPMASPSQQGRAIILQPPQPPATRAPGSDGWIASYCGGHEFSVTRAAAELWPVLLVFSISAIVDHYVDPYVRPVSDYDNGPSILFEKREQSVPAVIMIFLGYGVPMIVFFVIAFIRFDAMILYRSLLGLLEVYTFAHVLTTFGKKMSGSLRPNFLALCEWNGTECTGSYHDTQSGRQSFPSGHASLSMAGLCYLSLFLNLQIPILIPRMPKTYVRMGVLAPVLLAYWVAVTRTHDYYHRFEDIVAGMAIGILAAVYIFSSIFGTQCKRCEEQLPYACPRDV